MRSRSRSTTACRSSGPSKTSTPPMCMWTGARSAWIADRSEGERGSGIRRRPYSRLWRVAARALLGGAEDVVPERGADAEAAGVVLEVVAHVELSEQPSRAGTRLVMV